MYTIESTEGEDHKLLFITKCTVGEFVATGRGSTKKLSRKDAANKILNLIRAGHVEITAVAPGNKDQSISKQIIKRQKLHPTNGNLVLVKDSS